MSHLSRRQLMAALGAGSASLLLDRPAQASLAVACRWPIQTGELTQEGFLALYADNRGRQIPNLITESFLVHGLALSERKATIALEVETLIPLFKQWVDAANAGLATASPNALAVQLGQVLAALIGESSGSADGAVAAELKAVMEAKGVSPSPLLRISIDYSQMRPRGHYASDPALSAYFRASRYASTVPLLLNPSEATDVDAAKADRFAAAALALSKAMTGAGAASLTTRLFGLLEQAFGAAEDYDAIDLADAKTDTAGWRQDLVTEAADRGKLPSVIDVPVDVAKLGKLSSAEAAISWRMLPGRRLGDVAAMQALTYPNTGKHLGTGQPFGLGKIDEQPVKAYVGLDDLFAIYGVDAGRWTLERQFDGMDASLAKARSQLAAPSAPSDSLSRLMRLTLAPNLAPVGRTRRLTALAGHYVHYRHGLALYAKQSMTSAPKSLSLNANRDGAMLEPDLVMLGALRGLVADHARRLPSPVWQDWDHLIGDLEGIAWRSTFGCLGRKDEAVLNELDLRIAALTDPGFDVPLIADIHTAPSENRVVEIGIGGAQAATAGKARGGDFALYQFKQPIGDRLTDEAFAASLEKPNADRRWVPSVAPDANWSLTP
jgi:hypothetical protein